MLPAGIPPCHAAAVHCYQAPTAAPRLLPCSACRAPTLAANPVDAVSGTALLTPPDTGRPWAKYELTACVKGSNPPSCRTLSPLCTANANQDASTTCAIIGCDPDTAYSVTAVAIQADGTRSKTSNVDDFSTLGYG